ncbi:HAD family hydrolase [Psychromonas sp. RZ22]|uniref:HAD-IA family hydrolase n=1 Tax=Psychromonas algarum TaxID=2555643 RepID=UPI0010681118|nr:HAD-IA family hydrolase [Psychromonas sp. RZ22]TEW53169.1 HAD family hydrolase [Psychromonas sp. RZ22]
MIFYRPLRPYKAISFDLDDTLYDNRPIIIKAELDFINYLNTTYPELEQLDVRKWGLYKDLLVKEAPALQHDVSLWRKEILKRVMVVYGIPMVNAIKYSEIALQKFLELRSDFSVPQKSIKVLEELALHYPIIAITNGNVDVKQIGLHNKFKCVLKAENGLNSKPHLDLFQQAALQLNIQVSDILHVGDHLISDVYGAQNNNAQAVWFNPHKVNLDGAKLLPSIEIPDLQELLKIL